jgi:ketosteroid isomerase-like protein
MSRYAICLALALGLATPALAQSTGTPADHDSLRKLKADVVEAVNKRNYAEIQKFLHEPFMATVITQDSFTDFDKLKAYLENLYTRDYLRMKRITMSAEADDYSKILEGTFALTKGSSKEHYELADGRSFDMDGRWTAVSLKENGGWKLLAVHEGTNFLDNPVITAVGKSVIWFCVGGAVAGLIFGFVAGWFTRRARA